MLRYNATFTGISSSISNASQPDLEKWIKSKNDQFLPKLDYANLSRDKSQTIHYLGELLTIKAFDAPDLDPVVLMPEHTDPNLDQETTKDLPLDEDQ